jgi:hypothetical protein
MAGKFTQECAVSAFSNAEGGPTPNIINMRHLYTFLLLLPISLGASLIAQVPQKKAHHSYKKQAKAELTTDKLVDAMPVQPPPSPPTPEQGPSSPPEVNYQGGQLVIVARNSTMGDVLNAVKQKTGASVEMPASSSERVVGRFGPGAPRDVMAQLLNGSHFDYVLLGSPADPGALKKVLLMARASGPQPSQPPQQTQPQPSAPNFQQNPNLQAVPEVENDQPVEENNPDTSQDVQPSEEEQQQEQSQEAPQPGANGPVVKTPEQLLRELQQQQQQQQQEQQQNAPQGAPGQPPQ